jgi:hypothetical protein
MPDGQLLIVVYSFEVVDSLSIIVCNVENARTFYHQQRETHHSEYGFDISQVLTFNNSSRYVGVIWIYNGLWLTCCGHTFRDFNKPWPPPGAATC